MKKIKYIPGILIVMVILCIPNIYAASSLSVSGGSVYVGDTITVTATVSSVASWGMQISASGPVTYVSGSTSDANTTDDARNGSKSITATYQATGTGTINFYLSGDTTTENGENSSISVSRSVSVTERPAPTPEPPVVELPSVNNSITNNNYVSQTTNNRNVSDNNTYLTYLQLSEDGMTPSFVKTKTNYAITVGMDVNSVEVSAGVESSTSYYNVYDNTDLKEGDNTVRVVVTAEDGSTRTYYITVTKTADPEKANAYLENLVIENVELSPKFQSEIFEYDLGEIDATIETLNILTFTKNENAKVEVVGNENLKTGKNEIKIIVTAEDGKTKKEYKLTVTKKEVVVEENALKTTERSSSQKFKDFMENLWLSIKANALLVLMYAFIVVEFFQIVYLYKQLNKKDEILEKYGIDENGEMSKTRSGKEREVDLENKEKKLSSIDIQLETEESKKESDIVKFEDINHENKE